MKTITGYSTNLNLLIDLVGSSYVNTYKPYVKDLSTLKSYDIFFSMGITNTYILLFYCLLKI